MALTFGNGVQIYTVVALWVWVWFRTILLCWIAWVWAWSTIWYLTMCHMYFQCWALYFTSCCPATHSSFFPALPIWSRGTHALKHVVAWVLAEECRWNVCPWPANKGSACNRRCGEPDGDWEEKPINFVHKLEWALLTLSSGFLNLCALPRRGARCWKERKGYVCLHSLDTSNTQYPVQTSRVDIEGHRTVFQYYRQGYLFYHTIVVWNFDAWAFHWNVCL